MWCHENVHTELNVFAIQTIFANVNTCIENTKFAVGMKSIFRYVHDLDAVSDWSVYSVVWGYLAPRVCRENSRQKIDRGPRRGNREICGQFYGNM